MHSLKYLSTRLFYFFSLQTNALQQLHACRWRQSSLQRELFYQRYPVVGSSFLYSVETNWKTNRRKAIKSWSSKTQLFQSAKQQSILSCSSWFKTNVSHLWELTLHQVAQLGRTARLLLQMPCPGLCLNPYGPNTARVAHGEAGMFR